ncbi:type II toxin-antitoxin system RelE/ParE family toxin [Rhodohalobacter sulfatireducens]|uniref:Type II toxin-antitoxin system RelE/ParE family toxin n=1 Tax=Rhodohalobacter sulfatireducens TaxID=2911366 RepID=A0ABS9KH37_9BACT|nr:type II toxin-antitoxin system RelE/ParE family toxin [Rhodohalobacter sulfatireducens]MCG2590122.1 type II toxin-antitoxin system RelE/ParE family toxin [Rhodohalobacter sulfatireducens]
MKIIWTSKAEKHLSQIFDYIAEDSPYYASRTIERIISIAEKISKNPHKGRTVPEYQDRNIREVFMHPYRIIYFIKEIRNLYS